MITLPTEINLEEAHNLEAGFQQPFEIKNETEDRKATIAGIEFFTPVTFEEFEHYYVSSKGRIYNSKTKNILKCSPQKSGYPYVGLSNKENKKITTAHRLVALAFIENPENKKTVNHKNGVKEDNSVDNLEWMTDAENLAHARETGLFVQRENYLQEENKWVLEHLDEIRKMFLEGYTPPAIAHEIGTTYNIIRNIKKIYNLKESVAQAPQQDLDPKDTESIYDNFVLGDSFTTLAHRCGLTSAGVKWKLEKAYGKEHIQQVRKSRKSRNFKRS